MSSAMGKIRAGMGGWTYAPWEGTFYPEKLARKRQLEYAARQVPTIEVNGTYYSSFKEPTFLKWASETPDDFVLSLKGNRFITNRRVLAEAGESLARFLGSGVAALGPKLGPLLWQFAPTKKFDPEDFAAFLARHKVAIVFADHAKYPAIADVTGDFVYVRLQTGADDNAHCYPETALDGWAARAKIWAAGGVPDDLPRADPAFTPEEKPRDVFVYFITEGKLRAPFGAGALMARVGGQK